MPIVALREERTTLSKLHTQFVHMGYYTGVSQAGVYRTYAC
jgi:hypothetical protein